MPNIVIKRWNGAKLVECSDADLPKYCRSPLYVACGKGQKPDACNHVWIYSGRDPVPSAEEIRKKIKKQVPHM